MQGRQQLWEGQELQVCGSCRGRRWIHLSLLHCASLAEGSISLFSLPHPCSRPCQAISPPTAGSVCHKLNTDPCCSGPDGQVSPCPHSLPLPQVLGPLGVPLPVMGQDQF